MDAPPYRVAEIPGRVLAVHDGEALLGDAFIPDGGGPFPGLVLVHGGAFFKGSRASFASWGRFLASHGYVALSADYRLAAPGRTTFPACIWDVKAAVQHLRASAEELRLDPARVGIMGDSAGGYLAAMVGLTAREPRFRNPYPGPLQAERDAVDVVVPIAGLFDLAQAWRHDQRLRPPGLQPLELFLGGSPMEQRGRYVEASALTYVTAGNVRGTKWLISWGTHDEVVPPEDHSMILAAELRRAGGLVRIDPIPGAPHFWEMETEAAEPGSYNAHFAGRLLTFLRTWSSW
jgi:acetyl esterase/lipase